MLIAILLSGTALAANVVKVDREMGSSFVGYAPDRCIVILKDGGSCLVISTTAINFGLLSEKS